MHLSILLLTSTLLAATAPTTVQDAAKTEVQVKKSRSGYCHYTSSEYFAKTYRFEAFPTLAACINSGGKIPPGPTEDYGKDTKVKFSSSKICHDESSEWFQQTKNYVKMNSIKECLAQGGRLPLGHKGNEAQHKD